MSIEYYQSLHAFIVAGNYTACVLHWKIDNTVPTDDWQTAKQMALDMTAIGTGLTDKFMKCMPNNCFASSIAVRRVGPTGGNTAPILFETSDFVGAWAGGATTISSWQESGCLILLPLANAGLNGRVFVPGVPEDAAEEGRFIDDYKTVINELGDKIVSGGSVAAGVYLNVIYNRTTKTGPESSNFYLSPKVATQNRRRVPV